MTTTAEHGGRGRAADTPAEIPAPGWRDVLTRTAKEAKSDQVTLLGAGVAFYFFLALVPALVVAVSVYGLLADPSDIRRFAEDFLGAAPREVRQLVTSQLRGVVRSGESSAGITAVIGTVVALWSASSGMAHLMDAVNTAFDEEDERKFVRKRGLALLLTIGGFVFGLVAITAIAVLPNLLEEAGISDSVQWVIEVLRWPVLALGMLVGLAVLYRLAPDRDAAKWVWVTPGAIAAVVLWLAGSLLFSLYAANFGRYQATYGSLASIIVLLLWLLLTSVAIVLGAELNAEMERQTAKDTTQGRREPMGQREAFAADTVGPTADEIKKGR